MYEGTAYFSSPDLRGETIDTVEVSGHVCVYKAWGKSRVWGQLYVRILREDLQDTI